MKILSIGIIIVATALIIFAIWSKSWRRASRTIRSFIFLGYLILMAVSIFLGKH
jgi:hypothetical membrane protein